MITILIVDDEMLARAGIKSIIESQKERYQIVGEASDAEAGRRMALSLRPDIVVSDIIMPGDNGLTMIDGLREQLPDTKFVVLSCVEDIPMLQQAIRLGVSCYLLKSAMDAGEVLALLDSLSGEIEKRHPGISGAQLTPAGPGYTIDLGNRLIFTTDVSEEEAEQGFGEDSAGIWQGPLAVVCARLPEGPEGKQHIGFCRDTASEILRSMAKGVCFISYDGLITLIVSCVPDASSPTDRLCARIQSVVGQYLDIRLQFGISSVADGIRSIPAKYWEAFSDIHDDKAGAPEHVHPAIEIIHQYIESHVDKRIMLGEIADLVHMSQYYLCRFYKKHTGSTLMEYHMSCRIERAKALIREGAGMAEIAEKLGFSSREHFANCFKKRENVTPGRYKTMAQRRQ